MSPGAVRTLTVPVGARGERLDRWLTTQITALSRSQIQKLIEAGQVTVEGCVPAKSGVKLEGGEIVVVQLPAPAPEQPAPEPIQLDVMYENERALVINKPAGMVVHPAPGHIGGTLVNALLARYPELNDAEQPERPGIVHRLDRETSGLLVIAKSVRARRYLQRQFKRRAVIKEYLALVQGQPEAARGVIEGPIGRDLHHRQRRAVVATGRPAETRYEVIETYKEYTLLNVRPVTGRTHQIRVHLAAIDHPVVGDRVYGPRRQRLALERHFLHAWRLTLQLPGESEPRTFEAPLPPELAAVLETLRTSKLPESQRSQ
ncbi:MAG: RluA family pseudouridine synthase [Ardenticatenaceae bacterium]|nr:RluA family pseudouridine synthase [Ardenticatenaceae bacterium]